MVKRNVEVIERETRTGRQMRQKLLAHIRPIASFVHNFEDDWHIPDSDLN